MVNSSTIIDKDVKMFIDEYSNLLSEGKASIFIGSGISKQSGYAGWSDILTDCAKEIGLDVNKEDLVTLAEFYLNSQERTKINRTITTFFDAEDHEPCEIHNIISTLPFKNIWTTNYDTLIERSLKNRNLTYSILTDDQSYSNLNPKAKVVVHKIHGSVDCASKCVITRSDYESFEELHDIVLSELKGEMCTNSFLFLGYSFSDVDIQHILSKIRLTYKNNGPQRHYCIMKDVSDADCDESTSIEYLQCRQKHYINDMKKYGVNIILVKDYADIPNILNRIFVKVHMRDVFISGAYETTDNFVSPIVQKLAEQLAKNKNRLFTGYGKNMGADLIAGVCNEWQYGNKDLNEKIAIFPFPYIMDESVNRKELYTKIRNNIISKTQISIFICGIKELKDGNMINSPGCLEEYNISKERGNLIIPIGSSGGATREIWNKEKESHSDLSKTPEFELLNTEKNPDEIVKLVMKIISNFQNC